MSKREVLIAEDGDEPVPDDIQDSANELKGRELQVLNASSQVKAFKDGGDATTARSALRLRLYGADFSEIAETLNLESEGVAVRLVRQALAKQKVDEGEVELLREIESARLETITKSLMRRATNPKDPDHLAYARTAVVVIDRHVKLRGLDAPQKLDVTVNPTYDQIQGWVSSAAKKVHGEAAEADIMDAEVIEEVKDGQEVE